MFVVFAAHVHIFPINSDAPHVTSRTRLPLFSRATLKRLGEPPPPPPPPPHTLISQQVYLFVKFTNNCMHAAGIQIVTVTTCDGTTTTLRA